MEALTIKMLKDKGRTVLIINGADKDRDEAAFRLVSAYMTGSVPDILPEVREQQPEATPPIEVRGLAAVAAPEEQMLSDSAILQMEDYASYRRRGSHCISSGAYKGLTPYEALRQQNEIALVELFTLASSMEPSGERDEIVKACKQYMANLPGIANELYANRDDKLRFIKNTSKMAPIGQFINGYHDVDAFCAGAMDNEIENVFSSLVWHFSDRGCCA